MGPFFFKLPPFKFRYTFVKRLTKLSGKEKFWMGAVFLGILFTAIEAPFSLAFNTDLRFWQLWADVILGVLFSVDLAYHIIRHQKRNDFDPRKTKSEKIKIYAGLSIDTIACVPFDFIFYLFGLSGVNNWFKFMRIIRLIRIIKLAAFMERLPTISRSIRFLFIFFASLMVGHLFACFWVYLNPPKGEPLLAYYVESLYWTITTLTTVGYGDITPTTISARLYTIVLMIGGVGFYGLIIANITQIFTENAHYKEQSREKLNDLYAFIKHYHIPNHLQGPIFNYYNHIYSKRLSDNDQKIISDLPSALRNELQVYMNMKLIQNLPVFKYCSQDCLKAVAKSLKQEHYGPEDTIIKMGETGKEMFFIGHGIVDIALEDGTLVSQLQEGQFFGEMALLKQTKRNANVRAASYCDLYRLSKEQFLEIIKTYPELYENIAKITEDQKNLCDQQC